VPTNTVEFLRPPPPRPVQPAYFVAFGPHGPRTPIHGPRHGTNVFLATTGCIVSSLIAFALIRSYGELRTSPRPSITLMDDLLSLPFSLVCTTSYAIASSSPAQDQDSGIPGGDERVYAWAERQPYRTFLLDTSFRTRGVPLSALTLMVCRAVSRPRGTRGRDGSSEWEKIGRRRCQGGTCLQTRVTTNGTAWRLALGLRYPGMEIRMA